MIMEVRYIQGRNCWAIECDCQKTNISAASFVTACRKYLTKETFPNALWYHCRGSEKTAFQRVECYGPHAKRDAKDAAIILAGTIGPIKKTGVEEASKEWRTGVGS